MFIITDPIPAKFVKLTRAQSRPTPEFDTPKTKIATTGPKTPLFAAWRDLRDKVSFLGRISE